MVSTYFINKLLLRYNELIRFILLKGLTPPPSILYQDLGWSMMNQMPTASNVYHSADHQQIPTLADRLETYRQLAINRTSSTSPGINQQTLSAGFMSNLGANALPQSSLGNYTTNLVERTQDLRNWLKQAKSEHEMLSGANRTSGNNSQEVDL